VPDFLALEWNQDGLRGIDAHVSPQRVAVRRTFTLNWPDATTPEKNPQQAGEWLHQEMSRLGIRAQQVLIALPREEAVVRRLEVPEVPENELCDLVRLQTSTRSSVPLDKLRLDFVPLPSTEAKIETIVLSATVPAEYVDRLQAVCEAAQLKLASVGLAPAAAAAVVDQLEPAQDIDRNAACLLVNVRPSRLDMSIVQAGHLLTAHSVPFSDLNEQALLSETSRFVASVPAFGDDSHLSHVWLSGEENLSALSGPLVKRIGCGAASMIDPFSAVGVDLETDESPQSPSEHVVPIGLLLVQAGLSKPTFDFLNPRKPPVKRDLRKLRLALAAAVVVLAVGLAYGTLQLQIGDLDQAVAAREAREEKLDGIIKQGQADVQSAAAISDWSKTNTNWLEQMLALDKALENERRVYLRDLHFERAPRDGGAIMRADLFARERRDVLAILQDLADANYEVTSHNIDRTDTDPRYPYETRIDVRFQQPEESDTKDNAASQDDVDSGESVSHRELVGRAEQVRAS